MPNRRPQNIGEVLFGAAGTSLREFGEQAPQREQQDKQNALSQFMAIQQYQKDQRALAMQNFRITQGRQAMKIANDQHKHWLAESRKTPEQIAQERLQGSLSLVPQLAEQGLAPTGYTASGGLGFGVPGPDQPMTIDEQIQFARDRAEAVASGRVAGGPPIPDQPLTLDQQIQFAKDRAAGVAEGSISGELAGVADYIPADFETTSVRAGGITLGPPELPGPDQPITLEEQIQFKKDVAQATAEGRAAGTPLAPPEVSISERKAEFAREEAVLRKDFADIINVLPKGIMQSLDIGPVVDRNSFNKAVAAMNEMGTREHLWADWLAKDWVTPADRVKLMKIVGDVNALHARGLPGGTKPITSGSDASTLENLTDEDITKIPLEELLRLQQTAGGQ